MVQSPKWTTDEGTLFGIILYWRTYSSSVGTHSLKKSDVLFPFQRNVLQLVNRAASKYTIPTGCRPTFCCFRISTYAQRVPNVHSTEVRAALIEEMNSSCCMLMPAHWKPFMITSLRGYAASPYRAQKPPSGRRMCCCSRGTSSLSVSTPASCRWRPWIGRCMWQISPSGTATTHCYLTAWVCLWPL